MFKACVPVVGNTKVSNTFYVLTFRSDRIAHAAKPGHFIQMRVSTGFDPFLPRPMSICRVRDDLVDVLYFVAGRGTHVMSHIAAGESLEVWGPLGRPFTEVLDKKLILVGGGVGIAPMIFLASRYPVEAFLFGVRTKDDLLPADEMCVDPSSVYVSSNDGSAGKKGYITSVFDRITDQIKNTDCFVYTCGPNPMMELIVKTSKVKALPGEASMEEHMACGVGACLGCVLDTRMGRATVCHDGPVFPFEDLLW